MPSPGDLAHPGFEPKAPTAPALQVDSLSLNHLGSPPLMRGYMNKQRILVNFLFEYLKNYSHLINSCNILFYMEEFLIWSLWAVIRYFFTTSPQPEVLNVCLAHKFRSHFVIRTTYTMSFSGFLLNSGHPLSTNWLPIGFSGSCPRWYTNISNKIL